MRAVGWPGVNDIWVSEGVGEILGMKPFLAVSSG